MAVPIMPPVANGRGSVAVREHTRHRPGDEDMPTVSGIMAMPAHSGVRGEDVAVQGQPDPLEPDDQHEHQATAADGGQEAGEDAGGEGADLEEAQREHRLAHPDLDDAEDDQQDDAQRQRKRTRGLVQPMACPP